MKKLFIFLSFAGLWGSNVYAQRVINRPSYEFRNTGTNRIESIELSDQSTTIKYLSEFIPGWWVQFTPESFYLENTETGQKYHATAIKGIKWGQKKPTPKNGVDTFYFTFPPLPQDTKEINLIDGTSGIYGICLDKKTVQSTPFPPSFIGNWYAGNGEWKYGIFEKFVIYDHKFWEYQNIYSKGKKLIIELQNGNDRLQLYATLQKDGSCSIGTKRKNNPLYSHQAAPIFQTDSTPTKEFFQPDSKAVILGYLRGYDPRAGFTTGLIYNQNVILNEDYPTVITILPDGRFEAELKLDFPILNYMILGKERISFYITPSDTLMVYLEWEDLLKADRYRNRNFVDFKTLSFMGPRAKTNRDIAISKIQLPYPTLKRVDKLVNRVTPKDFLTQQTQLYHRLLDSLNTLKQYYHFCPEAVQVIQSQIYGTIGVTLLDYAMYYRSDAPLNNSYFNFLKHTDLNNEYLLVPYTFRFFVSQLEYHSPLKVRDKIQQDCTPVQQYLSTIKQTDSLVKNILALESNLVCDIIKFHDLKSGIKRLAAPETDSLIQAVRFRYPYLQNKIQKLAYKTLHPQQAYSLPNGKGADIFRKIIEPYKGKIVFVDFWATSCGPCCAGIKNMKPLREKYRGKDIAFVFITDDRSSPLKAYENFMKDVEGYKYRIPVSDYNYLRELFRFNGIPRYILLDRNGDVLNDNYKAHNLQNELEQLLK